MPLTSRERRRAYHEAMLPSPHEPPNALSLRASSRARERPRPRSVSCASTLWEAIRRTREALELRQARVARLAERFTSTIRPREETFTRTVCRLTEHLVSHHERTVLDVPGRTLLGLWIDENLRSLASHPFAPHAETEALTRRWRGHLDRAVHPLDAALANLHASAGGVPTGSPARHDADATDFDRAAAADRADGDDRSDGSAGHRSAEAAARPRAGTRDRDEGRGERKESGEERTKGTSDAAAETIERDMRALSARLFRRLARALHPDREQDETLKREKHRLMSDCLRARDERDIDTLLSLYVAHVGELPDALATGGADALERLLRAQLHDLQRRLRDARGGDPLQAMIVDRYAVDDPRESERRFGEHAGALDDETARAESTIRRIAEPDGLQAALGERREKELDRLWIDEMTGVLP